MLTIPAAAVGEPIVLSQAFLMSVNDAILLKLNETVLGVPWSSAAKQKKKKFQLPPQYGLHHTEVQTNLKSQMCCLLCVYAYSMCL